ncbi:transglycosylase domain-containing protein (plasmid) [Aquicoccus sp. G2-2]|uniref:transglycosylase domain-containing protein n=1 Tax=Aquicoccus sp. G2-2 TaxID=3092120 RepID=UPI002ADFB972|nr:transglycosylase domain-containing protein [Aquicoccus sp. G2-2]MEA1112044.1 transglycosylase domain-containing protein [Aquicoccus sp. G2-2]
MPQPETLLTYIRGRVFSGEEQMITFALERARVSRGNRGWEAAANQCLDKRAEELTLADAAILLIHMRSPSKIWDEKVGELSEHRNAFLRGMAENGYITNDDVAVAAQSPVRFCRAT